MSVLHRNYSDVDGNPMGGVTAAPGVQINWDDPLLRTEDENGQIVRGATLDDVLLGCYYRAVFIGAPDFVLELLDRTIKELTPDYSDDPAPEEQDDIVEVRPAPDVEAVAKDLFGG